jgi:hypothetical protein
MARGTDPGIDQGFIHADSSREGNRYIERRGSDPHLRALGRLMGASQVGQISVFDMVDQLVWRAGTDELLCGGTRGDRQRGAIRAELRVSYVASKAL